MTRIVHVKQYRLTPERQGSGVSRLWGCYLAPDLFGYGLVSITSHKCMIKANRQGAYSKGNQAEYSLDGLMLKLKFQYFGHLMPRADSLEKTLMLGKIEGRRRE